MSDASRSRLVDGLFTGQSRRQPKAQMKRGGGVRTARAVYSYDGQTTDHTANTPLEMNSTADFSVGPALLDFTDPTAPTIIASGVYAFGCHVGPDDLPGSEFAYISMVLNSGETDASQVTPGRFGASYSGHVEMGRTWYMPAGADIQMIVQYTGSVDRTFSGSLYIQAL